MNIKEKIEEIITKIKADDTLAARFMDAPVKTVEERLQELLSKGDEYKKYIEEQEEKAAELAGQINEKEGLLDALEKEEYDKWLETQKPENGNGSQTGSNTVNGTTWIVPINYTYLASPYGMRIHPLEGIWKMHNGVDLAAPQGTPIYASRSGTVSAATYDSSSGYYVQINHGDGYRSIYMHMTHYVVGYGQYVSQGQVIGYCGSTGLSTGSHLHFGISKNGSYVNPAYYIPI